jgi:competence protein ComEC
LFRIMPERLQKILNSKSKTFLAFCFCFIAGAGGFSFLENREFLFYLYVLLFLILFFTIVLWHKKRERFLCLCLLFIVLGGLRFLIRIPGHNLSRIESYNGRKVILHGWISFEPEINISDAKYIVTVESLGGQFVIPTAVEESLKPRKGSLGYTRDDKKVSGKIIIKTLLYPQYQYGEKLEISCSLQEPENFADSNFNYQQYLAKQGVWSVCLNPKVVSLGENQGNFLFKTMFQMKSAIQSQMFRLWPEPASSLMAGILYGSRSGLPRELTDNFTRTGVSHIVAVSGYNVSIIVIVLNVILIYIGLSRRQSFWFLAALILAFVFFSGATASVVRAGVMAAIVLIAQYAGRLSAASRTLVYAAVIMLLFNPYVLIWDVGFQLSFLSTMGLVYLLPILENAVSKKINSKNLFLLPLVKVLVTPVSAIIATLPLVLFQFGRLSLVAPLVNVLILWLVPWLMLFGFISLILSFVFFPFGQVVAWVAGLGLNYVIIIVDWFGSKSWSTVNFQLPLWAMILMYVVLVVYVQKNKNIAVR